MIEITSASTKARRRARAVRSVSFCTSGKLLSVPFESVLALGIEMHGQEIVVEDSRNKFVGVGVAVHFFAPSAPACGEIDKEQFRIAFKFGSSDIFNRLPLHLGVCAQRKSQCKTCG